jgi:hypothetical protein
MMGWISDRDMRPGGSMSDSEARWCGNTLAQHDELEKAVREFLAWAQPAQLLDVRLSPSMTARQNVHGEELLRRVAPLRAALEKRHRG